MNTICQACGEDNLLEHADPNAKNWCVDCADTVEFYESVESESIEEIEEEED